MCEFDRWLGCSYGKELIHKGVYFDGEARDMLPDPGQYSMVRVGSVHATRMVRLAANLLHPECTMRSLSVGRLSEKGVGTLLAALADPRCCVRTLGLNGTQPPGMLERLLDGVCQHSRVRSLSLAIPHSSFEYNRGIIKRVMVGNTPLRQVFVTSVHNWATLINFDARLCPVKELMLTSPSLWGMYTWNADPWFDASWILFALMCSHQVRMGGNAPIAMLPRDMLRSLKRYLH